jgi:FkbM family methyltransferase
MYNLNNLVKKIILVSIPKFIPNPIILQYWLILSKVQGKLTKHHHITKISKYQSNLSNDLYLISMTDGKLLIQNRTRISRFIRGKDYANKRLINQYIFTQDISDLKVMQPGNCVLDIGSNIGEFAIGIATFTNCTKIFAFEPDPIAFECLTYNINHSNYQDRIVPMPIALSGKTGRQNFYLSTEEANSSLFKPKEFNSSISVDCMRGDHFINNSKIEIIEILKMDAEGYEPEVLEGFGLLINRINFFAIDAGPERDGKSTDGEVKRILSNTVSKVSLSASMGKRIFLNGER